MGEADPRARAGGIGTTHVEQIGPFPESVIHQRSFARLSSWKPTDPANRTHTHDVPR